MNGRFRPPPFIPELSRRNDRNPPERSEGEKVVIPGDDTIGSRRRGQAENMEVFYIAARIGGNGSRFPDFSDALQLLDRFADIGWGDIDFLEKAGRKFPENSEARYDGVFRQTQLKDRTRQAARDVSGDKDVSVEDDLHEMILKTSSSV